MNKKAEFVLQRRNDGVEFGVVYRPETQFKGGFIFFHDYGPVGDQCYDTERGMVLDTKQMDMIMEWWQKERVNFINNEENTYE